MLKEIANKGYGYYLTLKILKLLFYPLHLLLWIAWMIILSMFYIFIKMIILSFEIWESTSSEFKIIFINGKHLKNFSRKSYNRIYGPGAQPLSPVEVHHG